MKSLKILKLSKSYASHLPHLRYFSLEFQKQCKSYPEDKTRSFGRGFAVGYSDLVLCSEGEGETQGSGIAGIIGTIESTLIRDEGSAGMLSDNIFGAAVETALLGGSRTVCGHYGGNLAEVTVDRVLAMQERDGLTPTDRIPSK